MSLALGSGANFLALLLVALQLVEQALDFFSREVDLLTGLGLLLLLRLGLLGLLRFLFLLLLL